MPNVACSASPTSTTDSLADTTHLLIPQGMDVVGYYATYGHGARIKMFHCMRADLTGTDCPYELVVVPKEAIKGDYHTVSASGVVQVGGEVWGYLWMDIWIICCILAQSEDESSGVEVGSRDQLPTSLSRCLLMALRLSSLPSASGSGSTACST